VAELNEKLQQHEDKEKKIFQEMFKQISAEDKVTEAKEQAEAKAAADAKAEAELIAAEEARAKEEAEKKSRSWCNVM